MDLMNKHHKGINDASSNKHLLEEKCKCYRFYKVNRDVKVGTKIS